MPSLAYYLLFCLCFHAYAARPLVVSDKQAVARIQDDMTSVAGRFGSKGLDHDTDVGQLDNEIFPSVLNEAENIQGKKVKTPYNRKILQQPTASEIGKRPEYSESNSHEENVRSKNKDGVEDIDVMDYAQPHRKPPIHNRGT